jgi:hypothetical protein
MIAYMSFTLVWGVKPFDTVLRLPGSFGGDLFPYRSAFCLKHENETGGVDCTALYCYALNYSTKA